MVGGPEASAAQPPNNEFFIGMLTIEEPFTG